MGVEHGLPGIDTSVHADIEPGHRGILLQDGCPDLIHQKPDGPPFRLEQIEPRFGMTTWEHQCMQRCHRVGVVYCHGKAVLNDDPIFRQGAKYASVIAGVLLCPYCAEVGVVPIPLVSIAQPAEGLKVLDQVLPAVLAGVM
jgi:hypothetical protein